MGDAIKHCFANLTNFEGRDSRSTFWWWILLLVIVSIGVSILISVGYASSSIGTAIQSGAAGIDEAEIEAEMMRSMSGSLVTQAWIGAVISLITLGLFIAAFVRRLRDAALPTWIAAIPVITTLISIYASVTAASEMQNALANSDVAQINEMAMSSMGLGLVGWIGYLVVIVCGIVPSRG